MSAITQQSKPKTLSFRSNTLDSHSNRARTSPLTPTGTPEERMAQFRAAAEAEKALEEDGKKEGGNAPCKKKKQKAKRTMSISNIVMDWVQEMTKDYPGVSITNFSTSWNDGLAFCALIHRFNPNAFDFNKLSAENRRHNFDLAFSTGKKVNIPLLLDVDDLMRSKKPEPRSVQTYVQWIWSVYGPESGYGPSSEQIKNATLA